MAIIINGRGRVGARVTAGGGTPAPSYLLDTYTGAASAFSLRKLSSTYTGNCIRVRRSSDNTEMNIGFDGSGNLDTTALTTFVGAGNGYVTTWYDQSGNSNNATQSTASFQPQIVTNGSINTLNGKPTIYSPGGKYLIMANSLFLNSSFYVANYTSLNIANYINNSVGLGGSWTGIDGIFMYDGTANSITSTIETTSTKLISTLQLTNGNTSILQVNGAQQASGTVFNTVNNQTIFGNNNNVGPLSNIGNISEVIHYTTNKYSDFGGINGNINTYYSIYTPLDSDASAFITAASLTDSTQISAVNTLVTGLKSAGIWSKMKAIYPFVGGNSTAHSKNLVNPSLYNLTFSSGWVHNSNGSTSNNSYANTGIVPSSVLSNYNSHMSLYNRTSGYNNGFDIGVIGSSEYYAHINHSASYPTGNAIQGSRFTVVTTPNDTGLVVFNRTANNLANTFIKTNKISTSTATSTSTLSNNNIFIGALNWVSFGGAVYYSNRNYAFSSIGDGLSDSEAGTLNTLVQAFQTTLGRQV